VLPDVLRQRLPYHYSANRETHTRRPRRQIAALRGAKAGRRAVFTAAERNPTPRAVESRAPVHALPTTVGALPRLLRACADNWVRLRMFGVDSNGVVDPDELAKQFG